LRFSPVVYQLNHAKANRDFACQFSAFSASSCSKFLKRNGVAQRFAMKLMQHSDIRLTAQVYTDEMQLPIYDAIKNLPRLDAVPGYTQIRAQILGGNGQNGSQPVATIEGPKPVQVVVNEWVWRGLSHSDANGQMERAKGFNPFGIG